MDWLSLHLKHTANYVNTTYWTGLGVVLSRQFREAFMKKRIKTKKVSELYSGKRREKIYVSNTPRGGQNAKRALRHKKYTQTFLGGGTTSIAMLAALLAD